MAANMYRVGDYVYFEGTTSSPYLIRRIEELNKTTNGNVEAKVMCFYRRRDISGSLVVLADKHQADSATVELSENGYECADSDLNDKQKYQLKHREVFLSRQVETLPATHIRGKCVVTLLNETESLLSYLNNEDTFFYSLVYDPQQKTLLADRGEIRVGSKYQAEPLPDVLENESDDDRVLQDMEELIWTPDVLDDEEIDRFIVLSRSVGTFARSLDCTSTVRQPSLHMSAAAASRDITLFHSMHILHKQNYDIAKAVSSLVPTSGPVLCRDEMEEWSASEANQFEDAVEKYGKDFADIRQDYLPWKSLNSVIEYYYMWKTTDRYVQQKRIKAAEAETKLKQVYIPTYNKPNPAAITTKVNGEEPQVSQRPCESCYTSTSSQWYAWGPSQVQCCLCSNCWTYWKKYGGLKMPTRFEGERPAPNNRQERIAHMQAMRNYHCTMNNCEKEFKIKNHLVRHLATAHGIGINPGSPKPAMKTRAAFCLNTTALTRLSRRLCKDILRPRYAARHPFIPIDIATIKHECQSRITGTSNYAPVIKVKCSSSLDPVVSKLGIDINKEKPALLNKREGEARPVQPSIMRKRGYEQSNGIEDGPIKKANMSVLRKAENALRHQNFEKKLSHHQMNGRSKGIPPRSLKMQMITWIDAPDDVYFVATNATKKLRGKVNVQEFRRAARNPWRRLIAPVPGVVVLD